MYLMSEHDMYAMKKDLKYIALQLCTCTWIEVMTGAGITLYLTYLQSYMLTALTLAVFAPLIAFHNNIACYNISFVSKTFPFSKY